MEIRKQVNERMRWKSAWDMFGAENNS